MDEKDILWKMYEENRSYARHHEQLRATGTSLLIAVGAGVIGLITHNRVLGYEELPLSVLLLVVGLFGAVFSAKHYERLRLHLTRAEQYLDALEEHCPDLNLVKLKRAGDRANAKRFPRLSKLRLNRFWGALHLFNALLGLALTILCLRGGRSLP